MFESWFSRFGRIWTSWVSHRPLPSPLCSFNFPLPSLKIKGENRTAGSHWEQRIFFNELMTGAIMSGVNSIYSNFTLACSSIFFSFALCRLFKARNPLFLSTSLILVFEDSGWYKPNYQSAMNLTWGKNMGCGFFKSRCESWPDSSQGQTPTGYFCSATTNNIVSPKSRGQQSFFC